jgi:hypothetical protein
LRQRYDLRRPHSHGRQKDLDATIARPSLASPTMRQILSDTHRMMALLKLRLLLSTGFGNAKP